jgi:D-threo-aldose 1-dehydrogenase
VAAVIPGSRNKTQAEQNAKSMKEKIPTDFWKELKVKKLITENAHVPS